MKTLAGETMRARQKVPMPRPQLLPFSNIPMRVEKEGEVMEEELTRLFLDIDSGKGWLWYCDPLWDDLLPLVRMEALRLGKTYPLGDRAVIMRSDDGWYIKYPYARLTKKQEMSLMWASLGHRGHIAFSQEVGDTTLRVSPKPFKGSHEPYLVEVIKLV